MCKLKDDLQNIGNCCSLEIILVQDIELRPQHRFEFFGRDTKVLRKNDKKIFILDIVKTK